MPRPPKSPEERAEEAVIKQAELAQQIAKTAEAIRLLKRKKCREDLYFLVTEVLFKQDRLDHLAKTGISLYNEDYHRRMAREMEDPHPRVWTLKARNTFKTYMMVARIIQRLLQDPNERILLCNVKLTTARAMLAQIKHLFNTEPMRSLFPEYVAANPDALGTQDQYTVPARTKFYREPSVLAISTGSRIAGPHFSGFAIDDPIDADNCTTEDQLANTKDWWERLLYLLDPGGWILGAGTIYHYQDLYADPIQSRGDFRVFKEPIAYKDKDGIWRSRFPERWPWDAEDIKRLGLPDSTRTLRSMMESDDAVEQWNFWHQMMLEPHNVGDTKFDPAWFVTISADRVPPNLGRILTIDSAWKGEETRGKGDYTAIQVFGYDNLGHIYRQDCVYSNQLDILQGVTRVCDLMAKWRLSTVVIEKVGQDTFSRILTEECRRRGLGLRLIMPTRSNSGKVGKTIENNRILALQPYVKLGQFLLVDTCPYNKEFISQAACFPNTVHDDLLDGAADVLLPDVKVMPQAHYRDDSWSCPVRPTGSEGESRLTAYAMQVGDATARIRPDWGRAIEAEGLWTTPITGAKHQ